MKIQSMLFEIKFYSDRLNLTLLGFLTFFCVVLTFGSDYTLKEHQGISTNQVILKTALTWESMRIFFSIFKDL